MIESSAKDAEDEEMYAWMCRRRGWEFKEGSAGISLRGHLRDEIEALEALERVRPDLFVYGR